MRVKNLIALTIIIFILFIPSFNYSESKTQRVVYKEVAVYPSIVPAIKVLEYALQYEWDIDGIHYKFNVTEISKQEVMGFGKKPLTTENYDVFVIGASARQYVHGILPQWKNNVRSFIAGGGGYVGICGGANEASQGIAHPSSLVDKIIDAGVLGIANLYANDDQSEEWQYLYKSSGINGGVPIACKLSNHPIVNVSPTNPRIIRYEGGPGLYIANSTDPLLGNITPLAVYAEEPSEKAPIHFWKKVNGEWQIVKPVVTDIKGQYAAIACNYGNGRVVLFGPHPEERTTIGGHVIEFPGRTKYTLFREEYIYSWVDGNITDWTYNWWMARRAVAWAAGIADEHLPPISNISIFLIEPNTWHPSLYINGRAIMPAPWGVTIIGSMPFAVSTDIKGEVKFYVDGKECYSDTSPPYIWNFDMPFIGKHEITAEVSYKGNAAYAKIDALIFNL